MAVTIRVADLGTDREQIIETLRRHLTPNSNAARFDWLYRANPHGPASAWIAVDDTSGEPLGMASAFPRQATLDGQEAVCWVLADFCIHERYRSLGPALQLNRACLSAVDRGSAAFCYDFPSRGMMAVYARLGLRPFGEMTRFAKVLRWGRKLRESVRIPLLGAVLGAGGAVADRWPDRATPPQGVSLSLLGGDCDGAFDDLDRASRNRCRLHLGRSAAYLNWRYRRNPLVRHDILAARRGADLLGYAVFAETGGDAMLSDLVARDEQTGALLLHGVVERLKKAGAAVLSTPALASHPWIPLLLRSGFRPRETYPVILYFPAGTGPKTPLTCGDWPLLHGDRDS